MTLMEEKLNEAGFKGSPEFYAEKRANAKAASLARKEEAKERKDKRKKDKKRIVKALLVCFFISFVALMLNGCTGAMIKADDKLAAVIENLDSNMSQDCRAGLAAGISSASKIDPELSLALNALAKYTDDNTAEYKRCYTDGAWIAFAAHGSADLLNKAILNIAGRIIK